MALQRTVGLTATAFKDEAPPYDSRRAMGGLAKIY